MNVNFVFPTALLPSYSVSDSGIGPVTLTPTNGIVSADVRLTDQLVRAGFIPAPATGSTTNRPAVNTYVGQFYFDTTLGIPVWRNAANTAWVNSAGATV
jgi:hypothetical protein